MNIFQVDELLRHIMVIVEHGEIDKAHTYC